MPVMTAEQIHDFLDEHFPQISHLDMRIEEVREDGIKIRVPIAHKHLRPGGTVSGPTMMTLADAGTYLAIMAQVGPVVLAVTTNLNINFLRKPGQADILANCRLLKLGKRLAVGEVHIYSEGMAEPVAHATLTYSIPPAGES
jgi:uncharacterized protein (TIGR00369 family)